MVSKEKRPRCPECRRFVKFEEIVEGFGYYHRKKDRGYFEVYKCAHCDIVVFKKLGDICPTPSLPNSLNSS